MHIEARLFEFLTAFFALCTVLYGTLTALYAYGGIEWAGTTALVLDLIEHYNANIRPNGFKAQIVTVSREAATTRPWPR